MAPKKKAAAPAAVVTAPAPAPALARTRSGAKPKSKTDLVVFDLQVGERFRSGGKIYQLVNLSPVMVVDMSVGTDEAVSFSSTAVVERIAKVVIPEEDL